MKRKMLLGLVALAALAGTALVGFGPGVAGRAEAAYPGAANVNVNQSCAPDGTVTATINWTSYNTGGQWFDYSPQNNGFYGGFSTVGPMAPGQSSATAYGLTGGTWYYARVNTQVYGYNWMPSDTVSFFTISCQGYNNFNTYPVYPQPYVQPYVPQPYFPPAPVHHDHHSHFPHIHMHIHP